MQPKNVIKNKVIHTEFAVGLVYADMKLSWNSRIFCDLYTVYTE